MGADQSKASPAAGPGASPGPGGPVPASLSATETLVDAVLAVSEKKLLPLARDAAKEGRGIETCAILKKSDLSVVVTGSNCETLNPIFSAEVEAIVRFFSEDNPPRARDCYFVCTHEPGVVALAALAQAGFDNFYYLFDAYKKYGKGVNGPGARPRDERMMAALFGASDGRYSRDNAFWSGFDVKRVIEEECSEGKKTGFMVRLGQLTRVHGEIRGHRGKAG